MPCKGAFSNAFAPAFDLGGVQLPVLLSSREEVESIFSADGVTLRIDDDMDGVTDGMDGTANDTQKLIDALAEASDEAYERLWRYDNDVLECTYYVRRRVSYIAAHLLSIRRGNPGQYCDMAERYLKDFEEIKYGRKHIPGVPQRRSYQPTMSNVVVDHRHSYAKLRVAQEISEGPTDPKQQEDTLPYGYRGWWF